MFKFEEKIVPRCLWKGGRRRPYWMITRGLFLFGAVVGFYLLQPLIIDCLGLRPLDSRDHLLSTSIFTSALLTFALIAVYRDIGETQKLQKDTLENQEELLEMTKRPIVEVVDVKTKSPEMLLISNFGEGVALGISTIIKLQFQKTSGLEPGLCVMPITRKNRQDRSIAPRQEELAFELKGCISVRKNGEATNDPIPHTVIEMLNSGVDSCQFQLYVRYFNTLGEIGLSVATPPRHLNIDERRPSSLEEMIDKSIILEHYEEDIEFEGLEVEEIIDPDADVVPEPRLF